MTPIRERRLRAPKWCPQGSFSLRELARRIGVSPTYLSRVETGKERVSAEVCVKLAPELGVDEFDLCAECGVIHPAALDRLRTDARLQRLAATGACPEGDPGT